MRRALLLCLPATVLTLPALTATPASALSCVGPERLLPDSEHVFTGQVVAADDDQVQVAVREVWAGGPVVERVWLPVDEELAEWMPWTVADGTVDDRSARRTWLFLTAADFEINACRVYDLADDYASALRPEDPSPPVHGFAEVVDGQPVVLPDAAARVGGATDRPGVALLAGGTAAALSGLALGAWWLARRRRGRALQAG